MVAEMILTYLNRLYECNQRERHEAAEEGEY